MNFFEIGPQIIGNPFRKIGSQKFFGDFLIRGVGFRKILQVVFINKGIKPFGRNDQGLRYEEIYPIEFFMYFRKTLE